jgi:hypothetical protein
LTEDQVVSTLRDLAAQDVKQVFVHPRPGLMTPYLSPEWFALWRAALREARRLDMNVWIYDENSYPSGFAGGFVPEAMPESRGRGLRAREVKALTPWQSDWRAVFRIDGEQYRDVTPAARSGDPLPEGRYLVLTEVRAGPSGWFGGKTYVDLLYPGVTEKFLDITLEAYRREIGGEFGRRVPGVFTDEPHVRPADGLAWTPDLPQVFERRWGYRLTDHWPCLWLKIGDWRRVRHNYYQVLLDLFIERWARPYSEYCARHLLEFTGHYWDHEWPNCGSSPDNMAMYAWHQRPAIDILMNQYQENTHAQFGNIRVVKELSSVANQLGLPRTLCEAYGAGGWDLRFEDMKRIGDWLYALGVNTLDEHLSYITLRGARKRDHPQSFSYHEPWWPAYHVSARYFARLSAALSSGNQVNPVLVLEPTTTAWMYNQEGSRDPALGTLGESFFELLRCLESDQVEYDLGCEDLISRHGSIDSQGMRVGKRSYRVVVLPDSAENLNRRTHLLLEQWLASGGRVLALGDPPARIDGQINPQAPQLAKSPGWQRTERGSITAVLHRLLGDQGLTIRRSPGDRGLLFHHRRQLTDGDLLFLVNTSLEIESRGTIECNAKGIEEWDPETGRSGAAPFTLADGQCRLDFRLPPAGSKLVFLSRRPVRSAPAPVTPATTTLSGPLEIRRTDPNVWVLDFADIKAGGEGLTNVYYYQANQFAFRKNGMPHNPWDNAVQFQDEYIRKRFPAGSGFEVSYRFVVKDRVPSGLSLVVERPDLYRITCNGKPLKARPGTWWLDKSFGRIDLDGCVQTGDNRVSLVAQPFSVYHEIEPVWILGEFALEPAASGFVMVPVKGLQPGPWNQQGCPFYGSSVAYTQRIDVDRKQGQFKVHLGSWHGSVAEVRVNGMQTGHVWHAPFECDISRHLNAGVNLVEVRVIGTLKNTLGPHHHGPGLGSAWPGMFQKGPPTGPPPGDQYATVGYGLMQPFVVRKSAP